MAAWPNIIDDDGTGTVGTIVNKALFDAIKAYLGTDGAYDTVITNGSVGTVNNAAPAGMVGNTYCYWGGGADVQWTGLAGGTIGQRFTFKNLTTNRFATFPHGSGSSSVGNKFTNLATAAPTPVGPNGFMTWIYDGGSWVCVDHDQATPMPVVFNAANFSATAPLTWTVLAGNVGANYALIRGRMLYWHFLLASSTIGGTAGNALIATLPFGLAATLPYLGLVKWGDPSGYGHGEAYSDVLGATMQITKNNYGNWTLGNLASLKVQVEIPV